MNLRVLLQSIPIENEDNDNIPELEISGLHFHSDRISKGNLFIAISGNQMDGHSYIREAIEAGAAAVVGEQQISELSVPYFKVSNSRFALAHLACNYYGHSATKHRMVGITGTNGKTTTSYMLRHILEEAGISCSVIGSVANIINGEMYKPSNTTPDPLTLHELIAKSKDEVMILEVSSHGLHQGRVDGLLFDYSIFTNLSHDHLNYHHSIEDYFETKAGLFAKLKPAGEAIIGSYNEWGQKLLDKLMSQQRKVYSIGHQETDSLRIENVQISNPTTFQLSQDDQLYSVQLEHYGVHNVWNASLAFMTAYRMGVEPEQITVSLSTFSGVPGRFETYTHPTGATFIVDYAHNPEALVHCFQTIKEVGAKKITHIFGFRGDGDPSKRKEMVALSAEASDTFILTQDDLNEIPDQEMKRQLEQLCQQEHGQVIEDRTLAIQYAWEHAQAGDWVLISGKGPEEYKQSFTLPTISDQDTIGFLSHETTLDSPILEH